MAWYLVVPDGAFVGKLGLGPQETAIQYASQAAAQAAAPYFARSLGVIATAVSKGAAPSVPQDSPGYNPTKSDSNASVYPTLSGQLTTGYNSAITGYSVT